MSNNELMNVCGTFGLWLDLAMSQSDVTVAELARKMRVSTCTVYSWLKNKSKPGTWAQLSLLCKNVGANPELVWNGLYVK